MEQLRQKTKHQGVDITRTKCAAIATSHPNVCISADWQSGGRVRFDYTVLNDASFKGADNVLNADFEGAFVSTDDEQTTVPALLDRLLDRNIELKKSFQDKWMQKMIVPSDHPYLHVTATDPPVYRVLSKREGTGLMLSHLDEKSLHSAAQK